MSSIKDVKKEECCGCTGCYAVCPKNAIVMKRDFEGFLYPKIDEKKCINCGLCLKVCREKYNSLDEQIVKVYAAKNNDLNILKKSSSGGISYALCKHFIDMDGIVYGTIYDRNNKVIIEREDNIDGLEKIFGSKYVQSDPMNSYRQVLEDLNCNKKVLFISTSCYVAGLKSYLNYKKISQDNLFTVDLVCHGTPSPKLFEDYINYLKSKYDFDSFEFRTKFHPWGYGSKNFGCTIHLKNGKTIVDSIDARLYLNIFFSNYALRPSCHNCKFTKVDKPADITIADYWGLKNEHPDFFDERGVSAVITHNKKGDLLLKSLDIAYIQSDIEKVIKKQPNLENPSPVKSGRDEFWRTYDKEGFIGIKKKYFNVSFKTKIKMILQKIKLIKR